MSFPPSRAPLSVTALNAAIGQTDMHMLLTAGARVHHWLYALDLRGRSALHCACRSGRARVVHMRLEYGAAANAAEEWGGTCGHLAAARGDEDVLKVWRETEAASMYATCAAGGFASCAAVCRRTAWCQRTQRSASPPRPPPHMLCLMSREI